MSQWLPTVDNARVPSMTLIVFLNFPSQKCNWFFCINFPLFVGELAISIFLTRSWLTCEMEVLFKPWCKCRCVRLCCYYLRLLYLKRIVECKILWWLSLVYFVLIGWPVGLVSSPVWGPIPVYSKQKPAECFLEITQGLEVFRFWLEMVESFCWLFREFSGDSTKVTL